MQGNPAVADLHVFAPQLLPTLAAVVANPQSQSSTMLEGCLQMLRLLVLTPKRISPEAAAAAAGMMTVTVR